MECETHPRTRKSIDLAISSGVIQSYNMTVQAEWLENPSHRGLARPASEGLVPYRNCYCHLTGDLMDMSVVLGKNESLAEMDVDARQTLTIRKWYCHVEETYFSEMGAKVDGDPVRKFVVAAAVRNPYANSVGENLDSAILPSEELGRIFGERVLAVSQGFEIQSYGKACIVGTGGEYEHGNALLTSRFADPIRDAIGGGKAWVPSTGKRGAPGVTIDVPLAHKDALYVRSHYDTVTASFGDAPAPDEIVVIFAVATRGRPNARVGGLSAADIEGLDGLT